MQNRFDAPLLCSVAQIFINEPKQLCTYTRGGSGDHFTSDFIACFACVPCQSRVLEAHMVVTHYLNPRSSGTCFSCITHVGNTTSAQRHLNANLLPSNKLLCVKFISKKLYNTYTSSKSVSIN